MGKNNIIPNGLILLSNIVFLLLYSFLSFHNRIAIDDFHFLANVNQYGIIKGTIIEHSVWSGRWASVLLNQTILSFHQFKYSLFIFELFIMALFIFSVWRLIHNIYTTFNITSHSLLKELNVAVFIISAIFYSTIKIDETWFWLCSSCTYLVSMIMFFLAASAIVSLKRNIIETSIIILSFIYIGGSCEPFALFILIVLLGVIVSNYVKKFNPEIQYKLIVAFISCLIAFVVLYSGQGNKVREQFFHKLSAIDTLVFNLKLTKMIIFHRLNDIILYAILFSIPALYLGQVSLQTISFAKALKRIIIIIMIYVLCLFIYQLPITYTTQDIGAYRALFPITLFTLIACSMVIYYLGLTKIVSAKITRLILILGIVITVCVNVYTVVQQFKVLPKYSNAYDNRIDYLIENKNSITPIYVEPLPYSGLLFSAEISADSTYFSNKHLQSGLGLKAIVVLGGK